MIIIPKGMLVKLDEVKAEMPLAEAYFNYVKDSFTEDYAVKLCENVMKSDNINVAIALGSLFKNLPINEFVSSHVFNEAEEKEAGKEGKFTKGISLARKREIARKAARTRRADPGKAKESEQKRQDSRNENKGGNDD